MNTAGPGAVGEAMTGREKIEAAFSDGGSAECGVVICYEGIYYRDHWDQITRCPWWYALSSDVEHQLAWRREAIANTPQDWFVLPVCASREDRDRYRIEVRGDDAWELDATTGEARPLERPPVSGAKIQQARESAGGPGPQTPEEIDAAVEVPAEFEREEFHRSGRGDLAELMLDEFGRRLFPIVHVPSPFWCLYYLWGFEGMMTIAATEPELARHACRRYLARTVHSLRRAAAMGARGVWIEECLTDSLSPAMFADMNLPLVRDVVEEIRSAGMKSIYYYCGNPNDRWEELFAPGADALSLEEGKKGWEIDIEEVVEKADGRCSVLGNLDAINLLEHGGEDQLRGETARQMSARRANGGRFVMSIGSPVTPGTPPERVRLYCDVTRELGS